MLVYWEMTQACGLACKHCRAEAMPTAHPLELNTEDSKRFLKQLLEFGDPLPHLILTGGDPLSRKDIYPLIDYANGLGLEVSITPSATPELTNDAITKLKEHGIQSLGLSLDGSCAEKHDNIRRRKNSRVTFCNPSLWFGILLLSPNAITHLLKRQICRNHDVASTGNVKLLFHALDVA